jgi:hypothetical protein
MQANITPLQDWLMNPVHLMRSIRYSVERAVYLYLERFIYYIKLVYGKDKALEKFQPVTYRAKVSIMKQRTPERQRLENRLQTIKCLGRDYQVFEAFIRENDQTLSTTFANELLQKLEVILNLERLEAMDYVTNVQKFRKLPYAKELVEAVVWVRADINKNALKMINLDVHDEEQDE